MIYRRARVLPGALPDQEDGHCRAVRAGEWILSDLVSFGGWLLYHVFSNVTQSTSTNRDDGFFWGTTQLALSYTLTRSMQLRCNAEKCKNHLSKIINNDRQA